MQAKAKSKSKKENQREWVAFGLKVGGGVATGVKGAPL